MKKFLIFLISLLFTINTNAQWERCKGLYSEMAPNNCIVAYKNLILAGGGSIGIDISYDNGANWSRMNNILVETTVRSILSYNNKYILVATNDGIYFSSDDGINWIKRDAGISQLSVYRLAKSRDKIFASTDSGLYVSVDVGYSWNKMNTTLPNELILNIETQDDNVLIETSKTSNIYLSTDSGISWNQIDKEVVGESIYSFELVNNNIFIGTGSHIFISSDWGKNWNLVLDSIPEYIFTSIVSKDSVIFAGTYRYGIYFSNDMGQNWTEDQGRPQMIDFLSICNDYIFAQTYGGGTYRAILSDFGFTHKPEIINETDILITPNPASDYIEISVGVLRAVPVDVTIYNTLGECVIKVEKTSPSVQRINVSHLSPGVYFVRVGDIVSKFVKM